MKYICVTEVDAKTKIPCTEAPQRTGPSLPNIKGLVILWQDRSTWPVEVASTGVYLRAPRYYGTCDDDADTTVPGVLEVMTEIDWIAAKEAEHQARKPYPSWIGYLDTMTWGPPVSRPIDDIVNGGNKVYQWDEGVFNWVPVTHPVEQ
jgi:hypothetical protein